MIYMGSKARHFSSIIPFIRTDLYDNYVEPFVGGANFIDKVTFRNRIGSDIDEDLICMWQAVSDGWMPPENISEWEYEELKVSPPSPLKGYAAFALSYGGKKFGGWSRNNSGYDYVGAAYRNALKQFPLLRGVDFRLSSYEDLDIPRRSIVYCDPPYYGATGYSSKKFNHVDFWDWVRYTSKHNMVYVSEYSAPEDFTCIWSKETPVNMDYRKNKKLNTEKLFILL